jgi:protein-S-isoprenylcysteine O-methyltransferase Ste14
MSTFFEKGGLYLVVQFALFGVVILINQTSLACQSSLCGYAGVGARACGAWYFFVGIFWWIWGMASEIPRPNMFPMPLEGSPLSKTGPYGFMRHPAYTGLVFMFTGASLALGSPLGTLSALALLPVFFFVKASREVR